MRSRFMTITLILIVALTQACGDIATEKSETGTPEADAGMAVDFGKVLISEIQTGIQGNNNLEFIELYNPTVEIIDLNNWTLRYILTDGEPENFIVSWSTETLIPPHGHYLIGRIDQDYGVEIDIQFDKPLVPTRGGLQLVNAEGTPVDEVVWGNGPASYREGVPAQSIDSGFSLERRSGGQQGNGVDQGDNASDFFINASPNPQNSGSPVTPATESALNITISAPTHVTPGSHFEYHITVENTGSQPLESIHAHIPIPPDLQVNQLPSDLQRSQNLLTWEIASLPDSGSLDLTVPVSAPWTYTSILAHSYYVQTQDGSHLSFGTPIRTSVEGGVVPIGVARELIGTEITIEGVATMYTGGYYAGSGNVKFYMQDGTGGVQVWVPDGEGETHVPIGARVRVTGTMDVYLGALEFIPNDPEFVEIISPPSEESIQEPTSVSIHQAATDLETLPGLLVRVDGTVTRVEEFTYSFELDLIDDAGHLLTAYIDRLTDISVETIEVGQRYGVAGILEVRDTLQRINPREQSDLVELFPPVLMIESTAPILINANEDFEITLTVYNHTSDPLTNLVINTTIPAGTQFISASQDAIISDDSISWQFNQINAGGESLTVSYQLLATGLIPQVAITGYQVNADEWTQTVSGETRYIFVGDRVPIWAIQGSGFRSPYVLEQVTTSGIVTGVFPSLQGFWIQETVTDNDPLTSAGIFINMGEMEIPYAIGDMVEVHGLVRETYQQTQIQVISSDDHFLLSQRNTVPGAIELDPPASNEMANSYYEAIEGMFVQVSGPALAVSPTSIYGEYVLVLPYHGLNRLWQGEDTGMAIMVDDGTSDIHVDNTTLAYTVHTGDELTDISGPLAFTFGRYKIEPISQPGVITSAYELPELPFTGENQFSIMTWNAENLFDFVDPHPSSPPRPSVSVYRLTLTKVANTILSAGIPTIIGFQEVENIGILEDIAEHELLTAYQYQAVLIEGTDSRGIDVGYLIRADQAAIEETHQYVAEEGLTSRPPLMVKVNISADSGGITIYVLNNHFTSMSGGEAITEPRRNNQSLWNVSILESILAADPNAHIAVIGDLNSYYHSAPLDTLRDAGLMHVYEFLDDEREYTYIYQGISQTLDHMLVSENLWEHILWVDVLHVNADYPPPPFDDETPLRNSDHDPLVVGFSIQN